MKLSKLGLTWLIVIMVAGCAQLGIQPAKSFDQRLAYAVGTNAGLRDAAATALVGKRITKSDAQYVLKVTDESAAVLETARVAFTAGDVQTAEGRLLMVLNVLQELQVYLDKRGDK